MRHLLRVSAVLVLALLPAEPALAAGLNLAWTDCAALGGTSNRSFACDTNAGSETLVASFILSSPVDSVAGNADVVDLVSKQSTLPAWWEFSFSGACRQSSLAIAAYNGNGATCVDWAQLQASMNIGAYTAGLPFAPNVARIKCVNAVPLNNAESLLGNQEYGCFQLTIDDQKTLGSPSCGDCTNPVCIVFNSIQLALSRTQDNSVYITTGTAPGSNIVTWQGAGADCQSVPVRAETWGRLKALYR